MGSGEFVERGVRDEDEQQTGRRWALTRNKLIL